MSRLFVEQPYLITQDAQHELYVRRSSADSVHLYFTWEAEDLLASGARGQLDGQVYVFSDGEGTASDTISVQVPANPFVEPHARIHGKVPLALQGDKDHLLTVEFNTGSSKVTRNIYVEAEDRRLSIQISVDDVPRAYCACDAGQEVKLRSPFWSDEKIEMTLLSVEDVLPPPPFSVSGTRTANYTAFDSRFVEIVAGELRIPCPEADAIQLSFGAAEQTDATIPVFPSRFPELGTVTELIEPLRYITTGQEYDDILYADDPRTALEELWISCAGSRDQARTLMSDFYGRVQEANTYFTGSLPGWRTDPGLVHIVFGSASRVERSGDRELWLYGDQNGDTGIQLLFYHLDEVSLDRSLDYRPSWYLTVDAWRSGKRLQP